MNMPANIPGTANTGVPGNTLPASPGIGNNGLPNAGIMSLFNVGGPPAPAPGMNGPQDLGVAGAPGTTGQPQSAQFPGAPGTTPANTEPAKSPLDQFKDLWQPSVDDKGNPVTPSQDTVPVVAFDPAKVAEAIGKVDFLSQVPAELVSKATSGDAAAFNQVINTATRSSFMVAAKSFTTLLQQQLQNQQKAFDARVSEIVRQQGSRDALLADNPVFAHPAVAPMIQALVLQFQHKYPQATQSQLTQYARDYFISMQKELGTHLAAGGTGSPATPGAGGPGSSQAPGGNMPGTANDDWSLWFNNAPQLG